ncbi:MAG: NAD-dependent epimerase/dehydratase family protein [Thermoplasmata archaeon]
MEEKRVLLTGGAGFIGSNLADKLIEMGKEVVCVDNFSSGKMEYIDHLMSNPKFSLVRADLLTEDVSDVMKGCECVFHLAANPDVRLGAEDTKVHLDQNVAVTHNVLEAMRSPEVEGIIFTSTSTVYGEASAIPTPEEYGPLEPISLYGSSKLACEALISAYCHTFGMKAVSFRFANVVGPRSTHGVTYDFVRKLKKDPKMLQILGKEPGTQKSYCHVEDCISGMITGWESLEGAYDVFNIGSDDYIFVKQIADIVCEEMGLEKVEYSWTGGVDDGRGWKGDVRTMLLSNDKLKGKGWAPRFDSEGTIRDAARYIISEIG